MAAKIFRILGSWVLCMLFLVFLLLKVDGKVTWSWFYVFIPMWIYDFITAVYSSVALAVRDARYEPTTTRTVGKGRKIWSIIGSVLKALFQALLCTYLEHEDIGLKPSYIMIPLWLLVTGTIVDVAVFIFVEKS